MSHKASHWLAEIPPSMLKDSDFRVLFHLCDAHNSTLPPDRACFPGQARLREVTGLSNGGLNNALNRIEAAGLMVRRRTRVADGTKGPTYYILGCDADIAQPSPKNGDGSKQEQKQPVSANIDVDSAVDKLVENEVANSTLEAKPSPHSGVHHLHERGDKPVREPKKEPAGAIGANPELKPLADLIRMGKPFLCSSISSHKARLCVAAGLVSVNECETAGIPI